MSGNRPFIRSGTRPARIAVIDAGTVGGDAGVLDGVVPDGVVPVDATNLSSALQHLAALWISWISLAFGGPGRDIAFRLVRR